MSMSDDPSPDVSRAGLCASCAHLRLIRSGRGSTFYLCGRSTTDRRFAKYPRLPVSSCPGHERREDRVES